MTIINVVLVANNEYIQHANVVITSILENTKNPEEFTFHILCDDISNENIVKINSLSQCYDSQIHLIATSSKRYDHLVQKGHLISATYLKFLIADVLNDDVKKIIYIDADIIVLDDLKTLWEFEIGQYALAAVEDPYCYYKKADLNIPIHHSYFNSGVMVMNLEFFRANNMSLRLYEFINNNPDIIDFADQDAFNALLYDKWIPLELHWNVLSYFYSTDEINTLVEKSKISYYLKASNKPKIVHYCGRIKPWHYLCLHPKTKLYWEYLNMTPWKDFKPEGRNALSIVSKRLMKYKRVSHFIQAILPGKWVESLKQRLGLI